MDASLTFKKVTAIVSSISAIVGLALFVTIPSLGKGSGSIMQYHDTKKKPNIILIGTWIHHMPQCNFLWEYYKECFS